MQAATRGSTFIPALVTTVLLCLAFRICLVPFVDWLGTSMSSGPPPPSSALSRPGRARRAEFGGWLQLPWLSILAGSDEKLAVKVFQPGNPAEIGMADFRHYFVSYFIRRFVLLTAWLGAIAGAVLILRRGGGRLDVPWGIIAGFAPASPSSATLAAFFLVVEIVPHALWQLAIGARRHRLSALVVGPGRLLLDAGRHRPGFRPALDRTLGRAIVDPFQRLIATTFKTVGLKTLGDYWTPIA